MLGRCMFILQQMSCNMLPRVKAGPVRQRCESMCGADLAVIHIGRHPYSTAVLHKSAASFVVSGPSLAASTDSVND